MQGNRKQCPGRWFHSGQQSCLVPRNVAPRVNSRGNRTESGRAARGPEQHCNRHLLENRPPSFPPVNLDKVVRAHQPYEVRRRELPFQFLDCRCRSSRSKPFFQITNDHSRMTHDFRGFSHSGRQGSRLPFLERVADRNQPPHLIEVQQAERPSGNVYMSGMWRIERTSEQPDRQSGSTLIRLEIVGCFQFRQLLEIAAGNAASPFPVNKPGPVFVAQESSKG